MGSGSTGWSKKQNQGNLMTQSHGSKVERPR
jgi:hypothetical protein